MGQAGVRRVIPNRWSMSESEKCLHSSLQGGELSPPEEQVTENHQNISIHQAKRSAGWPTFNISVWLRDQSSKKWCNYVFFLEVKTTISDLGNLLLTLPSPQISLSHLSVRWQRQKPSVHHNCHTTSDSSLICDVRDRVSHFRQYGTSPFEGQRTEDFLFLFLQLNLLHQFPVKGHFSQRDKTCW